MEEQTESETAAAVELTQSDEWVQPDSEHIKSHYSALTLHRACPQAWSYRYEYGLGQPETSPGPELLFGSWWGMMAHADALERGRKLDSLVFPLRKHAVRDKNTGPVFDQKTVTVLEVLQTAIAWWGTQDAAMKEAFESKLGAPLPRRLRDAFTRWKDEWAEEQRYERPLGMEVFWSRALPRPAEDAGWEDGGPMEFAGMPTIELIGFIDEIYFDTRRDMVVIRDEKTSKQLGAPTPASGLVDSQLQLYAWGIAPALFERNLPKPRAVEYDRVRSTASPLPRLNKGGTLSSVSKNFDKKTYLEWVANKDENGVPQGQRYEGTAKDGSKAGIYQVDPAVLERITAEPFRRQFFQRQRRPVSNNIVRAHLRAAVDSATDIWRTRRRVQQTGEAARALTNGACNYCDYQSLCMAQMVGGPDGEYDLREHNLVRRDGNSDPVFVSIEPKPSNEFVA